METGSPKELDGIADTLTTNASKTAKNHYFCSVSWVFGLIF